MKQKQTFQYMKIDFLKKNQTKIKFDMKTSVNQTKISVESLSNIMNQIEE